MSEARAQARAGSRYPFLTQKERDIETGLDYFLARYYSSVQGRFISPDEFSGGPDELYDFVEDAADNPTFYSEPDNPQSLNKYQYYNNPLRYTDPDGHCPVCPVAQRIVQSPTGQQVINAAGAAATTTVVVASGALKKAWDWFTTPNPNSKGNTVCGMGLDCSGAYSNQYRNQSNQQNDSNNQGQQQGQTQNSGDDRAGKDFTKKGKEAVIEQNKAQNKGQTKCSNCGTDTVPGQQSTKGVSKPANETQVDHIIPKSKGGQGRPDNGRVLCRKCNQEKSNKMPEQQ